MIQTAPVPQGGVARTDKRQPLSSAQVIALVDHRRQRSLQFNQKLFNQIPDWYKLYRGVWDGRIAQFRNNVAVPFLFAMIHSDVARKVQISLGSWPLVEFEGYAPEDVGRAKRNSMLVSAQMKDARMMLKCADLLLSANLCGTGIVRTGWKNLSRKSQVRQMEPIAPGFSIPVIRDKNVQLFLGPDMEVIDRLDFWQAPGYKSIEEMPWVIHRWWADLDDLLEDSMKPESYFDAPAVRLLQQAPLSEHAFNEYTIRRGTSRSQYDYDNRRNERYQKPVEIWEMHGLVPDEFAPDGIRHRCIAIGNGRVVLKNRPSQKAHHKPFRSYSPMADPYTFDPPGKVEIVAPLQRTVNRLTNQKLDALDLVIDPQYVVSSKANINTQHLFTRAGRIILVDDVSDDSQFRPLTPNLSGLQQTYPEIGQLWQFMQLGAGINDVVLGLQGGQSETARGVLARQENVMTRLGFESRIFEEQFLEPVANDFRELDRRYLPLPYEREILGSMADIDPVTGVPYMPEQVSINYDDLIPDYRARAVGSSQTMGKSVRQQNLMGLLQILSSNPALLQLVNWTNFARQAFELFDFRNINELLITNQIPLVNQMQEQAGVSGQDLMGLVGQPLGQLDPQTLGALASNQPVGSRA